ncbi:TPA: hypothetical protein H1008_02675 [archaeon]|nr:hypothetical protein [Candidatus Undinarchaeales archaeon SRR5007147.bin71]
MAIKHGKVWESLLVAGSIIFAFGIIWGSLLLAKEFTEAQGALVLIIIGTILLILSETSLLSKGKK